MKKLFFGLTLLMAGLLAFAQAQSTAAVPNELQTLTRNWANTINKGDLDGWLELHTENIDYADHAWWVGKSRNEMRRWGQAIIAAKGQFTINSSQMQGNNLVWMLEYKDVGFSTQGKAVVTVQNGKISKLVIGSR
jgi:hypothetical protein